jgi:pyruvate/2-oxoglutarate dehydrogenase complex dihydrolipoamide acyltransferase (E2) component
MREDFTIAMTISHDNARPAPRGERYRVVALSRNRRVMAALMDEARSRRLMLAFVEADVTRPRRLLAEYRSISGESMSLTAYVAACLGRAVRQHPEVNATRRGRRLVLFEDVNVVCYLEQFHGDELRVGFQTLRSADRTSVRELTERIWAGRSQSTPAPRLMRHLPAVLIRPAVRVLSRNPRFLADSGVIAISNVGAGAGTGGVPGWGFAPSATSVEVTLGGIAKRLALEDGKVSEHEHLCLTVSIDHDLVDGATGARFVRTLVDLVASGTVLQPVPDKATGEA